MVLPSLADLCVNSQQTEAILAAENPADLYLRHLASGSRPAMRSVLNNVAELCGCSIPKTSEEGNTNYRFVAWSLMRYQHMAALRHHVMSCYAPGTANKYLTAVRQVLKFARRLNLITIEQYLLVIDIDPVPGKRLPPGRALQHDEMASLLNVCTQDASPAGVRDAAIIALLRGTGIRRSELVMLSLKNYDVVSGTLRVLGKGGREREVYVLNEVALAISEWLALRGNTEGAIFHPLRRGGVIKRERLSAQSVALILHRRRREAGIDQCTPHDLRRSFISELLETENTVTVQGLAGHADPKTTAQYDRRGTQTRRRAVQNIHVPYKRPNTVSSVDS